MHFFRLKILILCYLFSNCYIAIAGEEDAFKMAMKALKNQEYQKGKTALENLLINSPNNSVYLFNLANVHFLLKEYSLAKNLYSKVINNNSSLATPSKLYLSKTLNKQGKIIESIYILQELISDADVSNKIKETVHDNLKDRLDNLFEISLNLYKDGMYAMSLKNINQVLEFEKIATKESRQLKGLILIRLKRNDEAAIFLQEKIIIKNDDTMFTTYGKLLLGYDSNVYKTGYDDSLLVSTIKKAKYWHRKH